MQSDFPDNTGGINLSDSVFRIQETQAAGGSNFDYILTGGIRKRLGPSLINSAADTALRTYGFGLYNTSAGVKTVIRAGDTKLQAVDTDALSFTALTKDTAAQADPFTSGATQAAHFTMFNNGTSSVLWATGVGATLPVGAVSTTQWTVNGVQVPTGTITATVNTHNSGTFSATGAYYYGVLYRKKSTQVLSNLVLDVKATLVNTDDTVTINLSGLTSLDTTLIDQIWIYRSTVGGVSGFTTGSIIAQLASSTTTYVDTGSSVLDVQNVPRAGNVVLDNSVLPAGTYIPLTLFKRRLVTAKGSTVYLSDLNVSESWPTTNPITIPSGGDIKAVGVIAFTSAQAQTVDEFLVIFKERELWVITGNNYTDWALKFIDEVGCLEQNLVVTANGFLSWMDYRGIYLWDGTSKPIYCSRLIEPLFKRDGDLNKALLYLGNGRFFRKENQIVWYLSSRIYGEQKFAIKMDLRLTLPRVQDQLQGRNIDAVLIPDSYAFPIYGSMSYIPNSGADELLILGDNAGYCYFASNGYADGASASYPFTYLSAPLHMGNPNQVKLFHQAIAWVSDVGNWNLELDYWVNYKVDSASQSTKILPLSSETQNSIGLWDVAYWDTAYYDTYTPNVVPIIFNLENAQGTALQLQWKNSTANQPITIHGWSVMWSPLGGISSG